MARKSFAMNGTLQFTAGLDAGEKANCVIRFIGAQRDYEIRILDMRERRAFTERRLYRDGHEAMDCNVAEMSAGKIEITERRIGSEDVKTAAFVTRGMEE